ncbi:peroxisome proliferator-activated receptor gamma coactivator 1-alpha-like isoform X2 [Daktulosphaira vitifoliae]|nr:peroxisome proliferator-activated receptor gamma coactivator 1-alpha-like isoform X2 [Daktulosphaira vitifoliae]XP_050543564.1 peroxisome proliferator-activated receptor gamma coactivator 1-alpha-like isoform X2 [Daktulosphaira vitifoliae]
MAEMNELTNQVNLDYIFDSYYSSVSRYNTGFELPEDCQNMSFSELFDQELFSTNDNKDCKLTIKIEKEESLTQCYSAENSLDEVYNNGNRIKNTKTNTPLSINAPNFVNSKLGINRTAIKPDINSDDVHSLLHNPFHETNLILPKNISLKVETSKLKCEVKTEPVEEIVEQNNYAMKMNTHSLNVENPSKLESDVQQNYWTGVSTESQSSEDNVTTIVKEEVIIKTENVPVESTLKFSSANDIKKEMILETEKKKISWEEFRAKRGKDLIKPIEINEELDANVTTDNHKLEAIKREFDRNTAEHFIGQKRKMENIEKQKPHVRVRSDEDDELQKKRMKIEYIKKLLPSSFASEIAKTSRFLKGSEVENKDIKVNSNDSNDKSHIKNDDPLHLKKDEKITKKNYQSRSYTSYLRNSSRSDYCNKNSRTSSILSNSEEYYRSRVDLPLSGQYSQNMRSTNQRPKEQKRVVYVGQIPIKYGKRYLYNRFKEFGTIQSLTLHKKPDFRVYYAFVTYSEKSEAERAINHGNDDQNQVQLDIRFGERKQTQTPYYDLDDEWLTDWYSYNQPPAVVKTQSPEQVTFEEELQEFYKLAQIKKLNQIKTPVS